MIEQKQGHHHKQTNSRPMRGEEVTVTAAVTGRTDAFFFFTSDLKQSSKKLRCGAAQLYT